MPKRSLAAVLSILVALGPAAGPSSVFAQAAAPLAQRIADAAERVRSEFAGATLAAVDTDALEREVRAGRPPDPTAGAAWAALRRSSDQYNAFRARFLTLSPDALVEQVRGTGTQLGLPPERTEAAVSRYQQLQATLLQNGIAWRDGKFVKPNGRPFSAAEFSAFVDRRVPRLDAPSAQVLSAKNRELAGIQTLAQSDPAAAVQRLDQLLYGLSRRPDLLERAQGSVPLETTLALVQRTYQSLPARYQEQAKPNLQEVDRQIQGILARKVQVPAPGAAGAAAPPTPLSTKFQLSFYAALSALPLTSAWARERFFAVQSSDALRRNPNVSNYEVSDKDPWGRPRKGAYIGLKDGSRRYESADGLVVITSADGRRVVAEDQAKGTYSQTVDGAEILSWTRDARTGALSGRFRGRAFDVARDENLVLAPDGNTLLIAKGFDKDGKPAVERWLGLNHERGAALPGGIGEARARMEGDQFHKDVILRPSLLRGMTEGKGLDLSGVPPEYLEPAARERYARFLQELPNFGALFADALAQRGGVDAPNSIWVESFYFRDGQMHLVLGERGAGEAAARAASYNHQIVAVPDGATGGLKVFVMSGSTTFLWKMNAQGTRLDQYRPNAEAQGEGRVAFELSRRMELQGSRWVTTRNLPPQTKEWTTWDSIKAMGGGVVHGVGEGVGILFSPVDTALKGAVGGIWLAGGAVGSAINRDSAVAAFSKVAGVYTMRQAKFNEWLGQGTKGEAQIMDAYRQALSVVNDHARKDLEAMLNFEVDKARKTAYGELYEFHARDPITDTDRAYAAARVFGLDNLPGQYMQAGQEAIQRGGAGNVALGALNYGAAVVVIGGQAYVQGFGLGLAATPLKAMAVGSRVGLSGEEVVGAMSRAAAVQRGEAAAALTAREAQAVRLMNAAGTVEMGVFLAPGAAGMGSDLAGLYQSWTRGDRESAWAHMNGFFSNAAGFSAMGLGLVQARLSAFAASRSAPPVSRPAAPPEPIRPPEVVRAEPAAPERPAAAPPRGPEVLSVQDARALINRTDGAVRADLERIKAERAKAGLETTPEQERDIYMTRFYRRLNPEQGVVGRSQGRGGVVMLDTNTGLTADPRLAGKGVVVDHHGPYFDPKNPEVDTSMQVLEQIEAALRGKGTAERKAALLRQRFQRISTDNLGDGAMSIWIVRNLDRVMADPALRARLRQATWFEDFGVFGRKAYRDAETDPQLAGSIELQRSIFKVYDDALKKYGIQGVDRFESLPADRQLAMLAEVERGITRSIDDPGFRGANARSFQKGIEAARAQVEAARLRPSLDLQVRMSKEGIGPKALDDIFIFNADRIQGDVFASWGGPAIAHDKPLQLSFKSLPEGRTQFILAKPNGEAPVDLKPLGEWLDKANKAKAERLGVAPDKAGAVLGRDELQFAFPPGILLTPEEVMLEVARYRNRGAKPAAAPPAAPANPAAKPAPAGPAKPPVAPAAAPTMVELFDRLSKMTPAEAGRLEANPTIARNLLVRATQSNSLASPVAGEYRAAVDGNRVGVISRLQTQWKAEIQARGEAAAKAMGVAPGDLITHGTTLKGFMGMLLSGGLEATSSYSGMSGEGMRFWGGNGLDIGASYAAKRGLAQGQPGVMVLMRNPTLKVVQGETLSRRPVVDGDFVAAVVYDGRQAVLLDRRALQALARSSKAWQDGAVDQAHRGSMKAFDEWERVRDRLVPR